MRNITVDLSADRQDAIHLFGGFEGEHNATELSVILPERMKSEEAVEYRFVFETAKGEVIFSAPIPLDEGTLSVSLVKNLMLAPRLTVYVGCYRYEDGVLVRLCKSGQIVLGIRNPEEGEICEWNGEGGCVPGIVMEDEVLPDSSNPIKSSALYGALKEKVPFSHITDKVREESEAGEKLPTEKAVAARFSSFVPKENFAEEVKKVGDTAYADKEAASLFASSIQNVAASAVRGEGQGNPLRLNDISPIEHEMEVTIEGEKIGFGTVTRYGKNLLPITRKLSFPTDNGYSVDCNIPSPFVFSMTFDITASATASGGAIFQLTYDDETVEYISAGTWALDTLTGIVSKLISKNEGKTLVKVSFPNWCNLTATVYDIQIESGTVHTECEPYKEPQTYTADENGNVNGITSLYPTTTLIADNGAVISAEYNKDTNKVIESLVNAIISLGGNV